MGPSPSPTTTASKPPSRRDLGRTVACGPPATSRGGFVAPSRMRRATSTITGACRVVPPTPTTEAPVSMTPSAACVGVIPRCQASRTLAWCPLDSKAAATATSPRGGTSFREAWSGGTPRPSQGAVSRRMSTAKNLLAGHGSQVGPLLPAGRIAQHACNPASNWRVSAASRGESATTSATDRFPSSNAQTAAAGENKSTLVKFPIGSRNNTSAPSPEDRTRCVLGRKTISGGSQA